MKRKIISFITSAVMAATCLGGGLSGLTGKINLVNEPLTADTQTYSAAMQYGDYLYYKTDDEDEDGTYDYVEINGCDESAVSVDIPSEIDGLPVTSIGSSAFSDCTSLESITLPDSVTSIGLSAFDNCSILASITIENPYCEIYDYKYTISDTATIYGYENSTAQTYAEKYNRKFVSLGEKPAGIKGDLNGDGKINVADVVLMQKYMVNIEVKFDSDASDINGDGKLNVFDVILLKRIVLNSI